MMDESPEKSGRGLEKFLNSVVTVTVKDGRRFRGKLVEYDEYLNILLEDTEEIGKEVRYPLLFIKGGNIGDISL